MTPLVHVMSAGLPSPECFMFQSLVRIARAGKNFALYLREKLCMDPSG